MQLLMFQIKMLRDRIDDQRIVPTPEERAELLRLGNEINHEVADVMLVVKPQIYRRWLTPKAKTRSPKPAGRPGTAEDIVALILRMATENLSWGYKRIFGELKKLGISVGLTTIRDILKRSDCPPPPEKTKSRPALPWSKFVSAHMESLVACDFFTKPAYTLRGKLDGYVLVFLHLIDSGVPVENILFLDLADDRLSWLRHENPDLILDAYFELHPQKRCIETIHCFFDEVQALSHWQLFIDRILRDEKCEVTVAGSLLPSPEEETANPLAGRIVSWEIFPLSFREFLDGKEIESDGPLSTKQRLTIQKAFEDYWQVGGFPGVNRLDQRQRIAAHQANWNAIPASIIVHHNISHPRAVINLAQWLVDNTGSYYSVSHLTDYLKSLGHRVRKSSVVDWLAAFEDAGLLFSVNIVSSSPTRISVNPGKVYCIDHALATSVNSGILTNRDSLLENLVFTALRRVTPEIFYHKTKTGREVDLVALLPSGPGQEQAVMLIQVCASLADPRVKQSQVRSISEAMVELAVAEGIIVTWRTNETIPVGFGTIQVMPFWRFLLEMEPRT